MKDIHSPSEQDYIQQLSIDCVIFGYRDSQLSVLVPKLNFRGDFWALPSGFIYQNEGIDQAARLGDAARALGPQFDQIHGRSSSGRQNAAPTTGGIRGKPAVAGA